MNASKSFPRVIERGSMQHRAIQIAGLAIVLVATMAGGQTDPFRMGQLVTVFIYAIAISGLNLVSGYGGMLSIGHAALFGLGAYATAALDVHAYIEPIATLPIVVGLGLVAGLVMGLPAIRVRGLYLTLVTLAVGVSFPELVARFPSLTGGQLGISIPTIDLWPPTWTPFSRAETVQWLYWLSWSVLVLVLMLTTNLSRSRLGLAIRALRDNEIGAVGSGIDPHLTRILLFGASGAVTALAGGLFATYIGALSASSSFSVLTSIQLVTALIIGGNATVFGPVIAGFAIIYGPYYISEWGSGQAYGLVFGVILIAIVFVMPDGLVGRVTAIAGRIVTVKPPINPKRIEPQSGRSAIGQSTKIASGTNPVQSQSKEIV